jgi:hypothetical protein
LLTTFKPSINISSYRITFVLKNDTFVPKKMIVVDTKFKTADNTNFKPMLIQEVMKRDENGVELPTLIKDVASGIGTSVAELKQVIAHLFKDKVYTHNDYIIATKQVLFVLIPNFASASNGEGAEQLFDNMKRNRAVGSLLKAKKLSEVEDLFGFISLHYKSFPSNPFLRYKSGWENRDFFYEHIVSADVKVDEVSKHCIKVAKRYSKKYLINGFSINALMAGSKMELDSDIAISIILDSGLFSTINWGAGKNVLITDSDIAFTKNIDIIKRIINETKCEITDIAMIEKTATKYGRDFNENIIKSSISANRSIFVEQEAS